MGRRNRSVIPTHVLALFLAPVISACQLQHTQGQARFDQAEPVVRAETRQGGETFTGQQALARGDLSVAKTAFGAALRKDPSDAGAALGLAETHMALNELQAARQIYEALIAKAPGLSARVNQGLGLIALRTGRADQAASFLGKSVQQDDRLWRAWLGLGQAHDRLDQPEAARRAFAAAERVAPLQAPVLNDLGMSYVSQKQPEPALKFFERALELDPRYEIARGNIRVAKAMMRRYEDAVSGATGDQLPDVLNNVGYVAILNKDFQVADRYLRRAIDISPVYHQAAIANLDLLARVVAENGSDRQIAAADFSDDAQVVLAPASAGPAVAPDIETADAPATDSTTDRVAMAATRRATPAEDLEALASPVVESIVSSGSSANDVETPRDRVFNWDRDNLQAANAATTQESQASTAKGAQTDAPAFKWEEQSNRNTKQATADEDATRPDAKASLKDRTFTWQEPAASIQIETADTRAPNSALDSDVGPGAERTFKWQEMPTNKTTEVADRPAPEATKPGDEGGAAERAFRWEDTQPSPLPMKTADLMEPHPPLDQRADGKDQSIEVTELRAPLLVDGLQPKDKNGNPITIVPPVEN